MPAAATAKQRVRTTYNMQVTEPVVTRASEPDWSGWEKWLRSHLDIEREVMTEAFGEILAIPAPSPLHSHLSRLCVLIC